MLTHNSTDWNVKSLRGRLHRLLPGPIGQQLQNKGQLHVDLIKSTVNACQKLFRVVVVEVHRVRRHGAAHRRLDDGAQLCLQLQRRCGG